MGVQRITSPNGDVWWVKRAWVPRYRGLRDRVGDYLEVRPRRWYQAPLRVYARGYDRWVLQDALNSVAAAPWPSTSAELGETAEPPAPDAGVLAPDIAHALGVDQGGGGDFGAPSDQTPVPLIDLGGGGDLADGAVAFPDGAALADLGGGGGAGPGAGAGGGGGGDAGGDPGDFGVVILAAFAVLVLLVVAGWVLLPVLMAVVDGAVLVIAILAAGAARVLLRRPWDVVATQDLPDGLQLVHRWELRGYRRAGAARDDVARALETGTDADLAVARVVVREPRKDDPAGIARSAREVHWR